MASPTSHDGEVFFIPRGKDRSEERTISTWEWTIRGTYSSVEETMTSEVVKVEWYKYMYGLKHEYAIATVRRAGKTYYIRFERCASDEMQVSNNTGITGEDAFSAQSILGEEVVQYTTPIAQLQKELKEDIQVEKGVLRRKMWTSVHKSINKISKDKPIAKDTAFQVLSSSGRTTADDRGDVYLLASYEFKPASLCLRDLVFTLYQVSESSEVYYVLLKQCYWFVRTVIGILEKDYQPIIHKSPHFNMAGMYWTGRFTGTIGRTCFKINEDNVVEVSRLARDAQDRIGAHNKVLFEKYMNGVGGRIRAEEELRAKNEELERMKQERELEKAEAQGQAKALAQRILELEAQLVESPGVTVSGRPLNVH